jgi:hypothetical protein
MTEKTITIDIEITTEMLEKHKDTISQIIGEQTLADIINIWKTEDHLMYEGLLSALKCNYGLEIQEIEKE